MRDSPQKGAGMRDQGPTLPDPAQRQKKIVRFFIEIELQDRNYMKVF